MIRSLSCRRAMLCLAGGVLASCPGLIGSVHAQGPQLAPPAPPAAPAADADPNVEVLTRGPVHEAYATPVDSGRTAGLIVPKKPADPIEELPPEVKPEGDNALWIPGYWSWDDDRKDFLWVSGVWRVPPPDYRWVPGYWQEAQGGFQWVSGFWMSTASQDVQYLSEPPQTLERGPSSPSPGENYFWAPGAWRWQETRYVWAPGYWAVVQPDWIYVPPTYSWTPRGWVYCAGYWDYPLARRGLLFSPVYFARPVAVYRPAVCVDVGVLTFSLFSRPAYCHYYFGDYYGDAYVSLGIRPWFSYHYRDPLYSYYRWHYHHHGDPHWERNLHGWHQYYRTHPDKRPPHTLAAQQQLLASKAVHDRPDIQKLSIGRPVSQLKSDPKAFVKVQNVSASQQTVIKQSVKQTFVFQDGRRQLEAKGVAAGARTTAGNLSARGPKQPEKVSLTKLPDFHATQSQGTSSGGGTTGAKVQSAKIKPPPLPNTLGTAGKASGDKTPPSTIVQPKEGRTRRVEPGPAAKTTVQPEPLGKTTVQPNPLGKPATQPFKPPTGPSGKAPSLEPVKPVKPGPKTIRSSEGRQPKLDRSELRSSRGRNEKTEKN